jgi:predicted permease
MGMPLAVDLELDARALGFTFAATLLTGVLFGLAPALQSSKPDLVSALKGQPAAGRGARFRSALVVAQVALSLALLVGAGLCLRALSNARAIAFGFDTERTLTARLDLGRQNYTEPQGRLFYQQLLERAQALPGVRQASLALSVPLTGSNYGTSVRLEGRTEPARVLYNIVTPHYLGTMGIPLLLGRDFSPQDDAQAPRVALVNEAMARQLWPNESPIGKRFMVMKRGYDNQPVEVIGLARNTTGYDPFAPMPAQLYLPLQQSYGAEMTLHLRTSGEPEQLIAGVRQSVRELDRNLPIYEVRTLAWHLDNSLTPQRLAALLISGFGFLAMTLAAIGLYGVMSYAVAQRTREIGIRVALGAQARDVLMLAMKQGTKLACIGALIGLGAAWALTRLMKTLLYGVSPTDPLTFVLAAVALMLVAILACWIPARRAAGVDPLVALRHE